MNTTKQTSITLLLALLLLISCGKKNDDTNLVINIEEEFEVQLLEELLPGANRLMLYISTKEPLDCTNYHLGHSQALSTNKIVISIDDLELEGDCIAGNEFVTAMVPMGTPGKGTNELQINLGLNSITNKGNLTVFDDSYGVSMETLHGITLSFPHLKMIPNDYLWGHIQLIDGDATEIKNNFFEDLEEYTQPADLADGHYGYFDVDKGLPQINQNFTEIETTPSGTFLFQLDGDKTELLEMVEEYQVNQEGKIKIVLYTAQGDVLRAVSVDPDDRSNPNKL